MTEKFNGAISATGISLISQAIENNTKLQFLSAIGSATSYTNEQLVKLTDSDLTKLSKNQTGHISNITIKNHDTVYFEITLDGNTVAADYGLNSVVILTKIGTVDHLFAVLKANQVQYMNAYDGKSSTNLQINVGFKISNTDVVSLEIDSAGTLTAADYRKLQEYTDTKSGDAERNANVYAKGLVDKEAEVRAAADGAESKARIDADSKQNASLASETKQRTDADNAINKKITTVENTANTAVHHDKPEQMNAGFKFTDNVIINGASELKMNTGSGSGDNTVLKGYNSGTVYGDMLALGAGGGMIVGSGESAKSLAQAIVDGKLTANIPNVTKDNEEAYFVSDREGYLITGYQNPASAKVIPINQIVQFSDTTNWQKQPIFLPGKYTYASCPSGKDFGEFLKSSAVPIGFSVIRDENNPVTDFNVTKESASWVYAIASQGSGVTTYVVSNGVGQGKKFFRNNDENDLRYGLKTDVVNKADTNSWQKIKVTADNGDMPIRVNVSGTATQNDAFLKAVGVQSFYVQAGAAGNNTGDSIRGVLTKDSVTFGNAVGVNNKGELWYLKIQDSKLTPWYKAVVSGELDAHTGNKSNPHGVTAGQTGAYTKAESDAKVAAHANNKANPHAVTAAQTGAYSKGEVDGKVNVINATTQKLRTDVTGVYRVQLKPSNNANGVATFEARNGQACLTINGKFSTTATTGNKPFTPFTIPVGYRPKVDFSGKMPFNNSTGNSHIIYSVYSNGNFTISYNNDDVSNALDKIWWFYE